MMPRKKRRLILIISIVITILMIASILIFLAINTDIFYSKQTLFAKYLTQNFEKIQSYTKQEKTEIENLLENNKYTSEISANVEYIENKNTSAENKNNSINGAQLKVSGQIDPKTQYDYRKMELQKEEKNLLKLEFLKQKDQYGIRLNGIKQFVSIQENNLEELEKKMNLEEGTLTGIISSTQGNIQEDLINMIKFSEQETQTIQNTYLGILKQMISKESYQKQANGMITVNGKNEKVNAYSITLTKEQYNNVIIKMLEKLTEDEIILNRIDQLQAYIEQYNVSFKEKNELRQKLIKRIKEEITDIQNNNIGQDKVKITVFEKNRSTIRTLIEMPNGQMKIDLYEQGMQFSNLISSNNQEIEKRVTIEKQQASTNEKYLIQYQELVNEEITNNKQLQMEKKLENNKITNLTTIEFLTQDSKATLTINETINLINDLEEPIEFDQENNVLLNELDTERINSICTILQNNIQKQLQQTKEVIKTEDITNMLKKIEILESDAIQIEETEGVTETEKNRFNSKFEFFKGNNLKAEHIQQLLEVVKENLDKVDVISSNELNLKLKRDNKKEDLANQVSGIIEKNKNKEFTVNMNYQEETGLIESITIKINEKK